MTESEAWLEIAKKCVLKEGSEGVFLCNEAGRYPIPSELRGQMTKRLKLFKPLIDGIVWWQFDGALTQADLNDQRALACCFLAVMAEEEEKDE